MIQVAAASRELWARASGTMGSREAGSARKGRPTRSESGAGIGADRGSSEGREEGPASRPPRASSCGTGCQSCAPVPASPQPAHEEHSPSGKGSDQWWRPWNGFHSPHIIRTYSVIYSLIHSLTHARMYARTYVRTHAITHTPTQSCHKPLLSKRTARVSPKTDSRHRPPARRLTGKSCDYYYY